jgi:O-antigen/teichoic acid export membrane protein
MNMTGFVNIALRVCLIASAGYIVAGIIGIELMGYLGAGIACAVVQAAWNVWLCVLVKKHIGVNTSILRFADFKENAHVA